MMWLSGLAVVGLFTGCILVVVSPVHAETPTALMRKVELQFTVANSYRPISKVALIVDPSEKNAEATTRTVRTLAEAEGWSLIEAIVPVNVEGRLMKTQLVETINRLANQNPQWLYLGSGKLIDVNVSLIARAAMRHGLPILASRESWVRDGHAPISVANLSNGLGSQKSIPVVINMAVASRLKQFPPLLMMRDAEIVSRNSR